MEVSPELAFVSAHEDEPAVTEVLSWALGDRVLPVPKLNRRLPCVDISCAEGSSSALTSDGAVFVWGSNEDGALLADEASSDVPVTRVDALSGQTASGLSCGGHHVGVVTRSGLALTFGSNEFAALGHSADRPFRVPPRVVQGLGAVRVAFVACGPTHTVLLGRGGEVFTAGSGLQGALGRGLADQRPDLHRIDSLVGVPVAAVAAGDNYTCAVTVSGLGYSWGRNRDGQLGLPREADGDAAASIGGSSPAAFSPVRIADLPELVESVACGEAHTMWVARSGRLYGNGRNDCGQLGLKPAESSFRGAKDPGLVAQVWTPTHVEAMQSWRAREVACGAAHTIVLVGDAAGNSQVFAMGRAADPATGLMVEDVGDAAMSLTSVSRCTWTPTRVAALSGIGVFRVTAGGDRALAIRVARGTALSRAPGRSLTTDFVSAPALASAATLGSDALHNLVRKAFTDATHVAGSFLKQDSQSIAIFEVTAIADVPASTQASGVATESPDSLVTANCEPTRDPPPTYASRSTLRERALALLDLPPGLRVEAVSAAVGPCVPSSLALESSGLDVSGLELAFKSVIERAPSIVSDLIPAAARILQELECRAPHLLEPDVLRSILVFWLCPVNAVPSAASANVARLCALILAIPQVSRDRLMRWVAHDVPGVLFGSRLVRPLLEHVSYHLGYVMAGNPGGPVARSSLPTVATSASTAPPTSRVASKTNSPGSQARQVEGASPTSITHLMALQYIVRVLRLCYLANERAAESARADLERPPGSRKAHTGHGALVSHDVFYSHALRALPDAVLYSDYERWRATGFKRVLTTPLVLCHYPFLLDAAAKRKLLEYEAALQMSSGATQALLQRALVPGVSPFLELQIRREHLVRDVANQIAATPPADLKKKLRVTFVGEEALDAGGVTKELFQLLLRQLVDPLYGFFSYNESTRQHWLNPASSADSSGDSEHFLVGVLIALAIYNGVLLDVHFPPHAYKLLLGQPVGHADLRGAAPELARGLETLLAYTGDDVEDVFCLSFSASYDVFGEVRTVDLVPGGASIPVTASNRHEYVRSLALWHLCGSTAAAFDKLRRGFDLVVGGPALGLFRPEELELLVAGTPHLDFHALEAGATYDGPGYAAEAPYIRTFWRVVGGLTDEERRRLLLFVTGCAKAPIGGLRSLAFKIQRNGGDTDHLPTASTCFNTLLLPEYVSESKLREKIRTAISECTGFGLM